MDKYLLKLKNNGNLAEIYNDLDDDRFSVCKIIDIDENYVLCMEFDRKGNFDGYNCFVKDDIDQIRLDTAYLKNMEYLINEANALEQAPNQNILSETQDDLLDQTIEYCKMNNLTCSIELDNSGRNDIFGKIKDNNTYTISVESIGETNGEFDGLSIVYKDNITSIVIMSQNVQRVDKLNRKPHE